MLLTSRIVRAARPRERRDVLADEHGMSLHVMRRGFKWWRFRYRFQRAERMISLGVYPGVNLATARLLHADARGLLARDIDPSADRKERSVRRTRARSNLLHASSSASCSRASRKAFGKAVREPVDRRGYRRQMRIRRHFLDLKWCTTVIDIARND